VGVTYNYRQLTHVVTCHLLIEHLHSEISEDIQLGCSNIPEPHIVIFEPGESPSIGALLNEQTALNLYERAAALNHVKQPRVNEIVCQCFLQVERIVDEDVFTVKTYTYAQLEAMKKQKDVRHQLHNRILHQQQ
jgi:hypothetical protein